MTEDTRALRTLDALPDELILHILSFLCLDVNDLLSASRVGNRAAGCRKYITADLSRRPID